jgi:hypothetical protein
MSVITLNRVVHKSTLHTDTFEMDVRVKDILAFHDGVIFIGNHQFNILEDKHTIYKKIAESGEVWD